MTKFDRGGVEKNSTGDVTS